MTEEPKTPPLGDIMAELRAKLDPFDDGFLMEAETIEPITARCIVLPDLEGDDEPA
jgi:hypothetical protein